MEAEAQESKPQATGDDALINSFCEITSSSKEEANFFLESHNWDLDAAVSTFFDNNNATVIPGTGAIPNSLSPSRSPDYTPSRSPSRSRSSSPTPSRPTYELRSRRGTDKKKADKMPSGSRPRGIRTLADLNLPANDGSGSDSDEPQEYYTGGEKRCSLSLNFSLFSYYVVFFLWQLCLLFRM